MKKYVISLAVGAVVGVVCLGLVKCSGNSLYNGAAITRPGSYTWSSGEPGPATCQALVQDFAAGDRVTVHATSSAGCAMQVYGASSNSPVLVVYPGTTGSMVFDGAEFHSN